MSEKNGSVQEVNKPPNRPQIPSSKELLDLYNKHIIEYYNLSLIKKLIGSKVAFSDFNEKSYQFLLHHNNDSTDLNEKFNDYQNDLLIQVFQELFLIQKHSDLFIKYIYFISDEIKKYESLLKY